MSNKTAVVLDTNVLLVALPTRSPYRVIFDQLLAGTFGLVVSNEILAEYEEQITRRYDPDTVDDLLAVLGALPNVHYVVPNFRWQLITADPDDNKFSDAVIAERVNNDETRKSDNY